MKTNRRVAIVLVAGAVLLVLGILLPWASVTAPFVGTVNLKATRGSDWPIFLGGAGLAVGAAYKLGITGLVKTRRFSVALMILGVLLGALAGYETVDVTDRINSISNDADLDDVAVADYGAGLFALDLGCLAVFVAGVMANNRSGESSQTAAPVMMTSPIPSAAPPPMPVTTTKPTDINQELAKLFELKELGAISDDEFTKAKAKLLDS